MNKRLAAYLERQAAALREGELGLRSGDAVSTHATRVAIRRYRSVLHTFPDSFTDGQARRLDRRLRWYAGVLGEVRDRQVLRAFFSDVLDESPDPAATLRLRPVLIGRLDEEVAEHWAVLRRQLDRKRYRSLVSDVTGVRVAPVTDDQIAAAVDRAAKDFAWRFAEAESDDADELMHRARKAAKRARYVAGVVDTRAARELATRFARMQEVLGDYQDQVVASGFVARVARDGAAAADLDALRRHFAPTAHSLRRQAIAEAHDLGLVRTGDSLSSMTPTLGAVVDQLDDWYPPATADSWDAVGLVYGDPAAQVGRVMFAVDPTIDVAREAVEWGADLLVVHHPLFLKAVHGFAATTPKGRTLATLATGRCALLTAHTNADQAEGGVSEALAHALGLTDLTPIRSAMAAPLDKIIVHVPHEQAPALRAALAQAGAGSIGDYDSCSYTTSGEGRFRPLPGANPTIGAVGDVEVVDEARIETIMPRSQRGAVVAAMLAVHPYEEPAYDIVELADAHREPNGTGRIGTVADTTLADFAAQVSGVLPATAHGVRVGGDPDRVVRRVAVCGGAGDFLLDQLAESEVDVYVTSDLRHHPAAEFLEKDGPALIDIAHWAGEWMWLPVVQARLAHSLGDTVETRVSTLPTDPWTIRI